MATLQHNITNTVTTELLAKGDNISNIKAITISNQDTNNAAKIDLFMYDQVNNKSYYVLKNVGIPIETTLVLGPKDNIVFDNSVNGFSLIIKANTSTSVDVIITR
jgi:hypothetical protein|tara:strand:+ start:918 stop:1232 length:315 start_codon:yes stop_codon:yes gene_type:complete